MPSKHMKSDKEWRDRLPEDLYRIAREKGTEAPFTGQYYFETRPGSYLCACCGEKLFDSGTKYESGSGWPSFYKPADPFALEEKTDHSHGMHRTEVTCASCGAHLGHVFTDGPAPTGLRYCINSISMKHEPD